MFSRDANRPSLRPYLVASLCIYNQEFRADLALLATNTAVRSCHRAHEAAGARVIPPRTRLLTPHNCVNTHSRVFPAKWHAADRKHEPAVARGPL
jgi:hypothetical protein